MNETSNNKKEFESTLTLVLESLLERSFEEPRKLLEDLDKSGPMAGQITALKKELKAGQLSALYKFTEKKVEPLVRAVIRDTLSEHHKASYLARNWSFVSRQVRHRIAAEEGHPCCADKTRTVMRTLSKLARNEPVAPYNYDQEFSFHLPKGTLADVQACSELLDALTYLEVGQPDRLVQWHLTRPVTPLSAS